LKDTDHPVVIAGAGIGGLATARALGLKGFNVVVLEQADEIKPIGYGIQLGPNAYHMFERLRIAEQVLKAGTFPDAGLMRDMFTGETISHLPMGAPMRQRYGQPYTVIHRADLHDALLHSCEECSTVTLVTGARVENYEDDGQHVVVTTADGRSYQAQALIGADGVWSAVRNRMGCAPAPQSLGFTAYRGLIERTALPDGLFENVVCLWAGPGFHLMHYPVRGHELFNIVAVFRSSRFARNEEGAGSPAELKEIFANAHPQVRKYLEFVNLEQHWDVAVMEPAQRWSQGRVTLLGDAAHAMLQALAQGACQSIEDGVWLAEMLDVHRNAPPLAFSQYERFRKPRAFRAHFQSRLYWEIYHAQGGYAELRRDMLGGRTGQQALESLAWLYEAPDFSQASERPLAASA